MLRDWRNVVLWCAVVSYACWIWWWASAGYPLEGPICFGADAQDNCPNYNVVFYSAWQIAEFVSHWAALITAIFIGILAIATGAPVAIRGEALARHLCNHAARRTWTEK